MTTVNDIIKMYQHDLSSFIEFGFHTLYPHMTYQRNWHIDALAKALQDVEHGHIKRLIINMPPRTLKSHCTSAAFPAWLLGRNPNLGLFYLHGSDELGKDLHNASARLITDQRYQVIFPHTQGFQCDHKSIETPQGGFRRQALLSGKLTGLGGDIIIIDDPISATDAMKPNALNEVNQIFDRNVIQRLNNKKTGAIIVVMQRLGAGDLTDYLLNKENGGDWVHLNLSAIALQDEDWCRGLGQKHYRNKGAVIQPARETAIDLVHIARSMNGETFRYQYLQDQYKPRFNLDVGDCRWVSPLRHGEFYDMSKVSKNRLNGFVKMQESDFILPDVFGIGEKPIPDNMRTGMTIEEIIHNGKFLKEKHRQHMISQGLLALDFNLKQSVYGSALTMENHICI